MQNISGKISNHFCNALQQSRVFDISATRQAKWKHFDLSLAVSIHKISSIKYLKKSQTSKLTSSVAKLFKKHNTSLSQFYQTKRLWTKQCRDAICSTDSCCGQNKVELVSPEMLSFICSESDIKWKVYHNILTISDDFLKFDQAYGYDIRFLVRFHLTLLEIISIHKTENPNKHPLKVLPYINHSY